MNQEPRALGFEGNRADTSSPTGRRTQQSERLEVRLDPQRQHMLKELAAVHDVPRSEMVRKMIDDAYEGVLLERRRAAVRRIAEAHVGGLPDADELARELAESYESPTDEPEA